jgi:hypothetical protein
MGGRRMIVSELIEALQKMPQDAKVLTNGGYDQHFGALYNYVDKVEQENVGWDDVNAEPIVEVYIL